MEKPDAQAFIGTSGYAYPSWGGGAFYPPGVKERDRLEYYAARFSSVELNITSPATSLWEASAHQAAAITR